MLHNDQSVNDTEALIKQAAKKVFLQKGLAGARLQEIADAAGIGRTALHYYFRSKEKLFNVVFTEAFSEMHKRMEALEHSNLPIRDMMKGFVRNYFETAVQEPEVDIFLINEFNHNPEVMAKIFMKDDSSKKSSKFIKDIGKAVERGELKGDAQQIFLTLISMCIHPFAARRMFQTLLKLSDKEFNAMMEERKEFIINFLDTAFSS